MSTKYFYLLVVVTLLTIYCQYATGYHISAEGSDVAKVSDEQLQNILRQKRQLENFETDDEYLPTGEDEEGPSFWDRVVKAALKLFNKFMEWLNS